jgi:uncharacterized protein involved in exopolysaccharide biosynthesis
MRGDILPAVTGKNGYVVEPDEGSSAPEMEQEPSGSGVNLREVLFILFRHKWKISLCVGLGMLAALAVYILLPPEYESSAKLFVRYVVDKSAVDGLDSEVKTPSQTDNLISSELEILTSLDLAREVAQAVGVDRLLPGGGPKATLQNATEVISRGLSISVAKGTNIINVSYKTTNPALPTLVLQELVNRYFDKHLEVHRSIGAFDFVTKEAAEIQSQLDQTDKELKELKDKSGIISLAETKTTLASELGKAQEALDSAEGDLASQQSLVKALEISLAVPDTTKQSDASPMKPVSGDVVQKYQALVNRLAQVQQAETELLSRYTSENRFVKIKAAQIAALEKQRVDLEEKYPSLINTVAATTSSSQGGQAARPDILAERARLVGLQSRVEALKARLSGLKQRADVISELGPRIEELERKKVVEEANYTHSQSSLEKARIDETLDPSRMPNISTVQTPSPASRITRDAKKFVIGLVGGGLALGIAIAFLIELVLDRTVKRSFELERRLRIPLLLSIPDLGLNGQLLRLHDSGDDSFSGGSSREDMLATDAGELLRPFCEAIRDRLGLFFELNNMAHKPKLVAVTGLASNAGASTLAAGLASALSEEAEGRVLLVDKLLSPKRFYSMLTEFKSSELDYVVFDMPSLGDTSATLPLAGFMDTVLLVVEAGKSNPDAVKRAYTQLAAKTKVSVVFNKSRSYGPKWLEVEP